MGLFEDPDAAVDDEAPTAIIGRAMPVCFADRWSLGANRLRNAVRFYAGPLQGEEPAPLDVRSEYVGCD